jgi:transposase
MYYLGIDIAKRNHEAALIDERGHPLGKSLSFANSQEGCDSLIALLGANGATEENVLIGMEATGHYWLAVYEYLSARSYVIKVINPIQSEAFRRMQIRQVKNDSKDSVMIAQIMRYGEFSSSSLAEEDIIALKQLTRYRFSLVDSISDCKRKVIALLDQVFPEYESIFSDMFGVTSLELLGKCQTPEDLLSISTAKLARLLTAASKGRFREEKAMEIKAIAQGSFGVSVAKDAFSFQIKQLIEQIKFIEKQVEELESQIAALLERTSPVITTIPGIGPTLGAIIVSEIGDIHRFSEPSKLVAYAGIDAKVYQSGEFTGTQGKMSKRGSPYLRRALWLAANVAWQHDPILSEYYHSLRARGKHHSTALGAISRKLCNIIFVILSENRPYLPEPPKAN